MATLHISLSDTLKDFVQTQVDLRGFSNASDYVRTLIREALEKQKLSEAERVIQKMEKLKAAYPELDSVENRRKLLDDMVRESADTTEEEEEQIMQTAIAEIKAYRQGN
ncbi:MAG: hypothetical protein PHE17_16735 [Thiothrix sp.]|uniref:ribbon-helix-helix domain-containing protein n=1 Tax=Thiothrix sp. TaxID=1032 RepID=UPI002617271B|nr:hypothetical protein [Thiothrix sp.]MDD5394663.1 hypothetical protein [Thiothrix sp.]